MQIWNWIRWWGWQQTTAWPCNVCDNDILKLLKSWFYFGKIWTYELKFLLCWASDWQIKEGKYIANMLWIVTMSISIGLYPILDLWTANKLHYITLQWKDERFMFPVERKNTFSKLHHPTVSWGWLQSTSIAFPCTLCWRVKIHVAWLMWLNKGKNIPLHTIKAHEALKEGLRFHSTRWR